MSHKWAFSPSSLPYLKKCIAAAPPPDLNNKWFQIFGKKETKVESDIKNIDETIEEESNNLAAVEKEAAVNYDDFFDTIESESTLPVEYIVQECAKTPELITKLAEKLSTNSVEKLIRHMFSENSLENNFLSTFITQFMPIYMKLQYSRLCIDLMIELKKAHPSIFRRLLAILLNDTEIASQVLINYTAGLNEETATNFINTLSTIDISSEGFTYNLLAIHTAYKNCIKDEQTQNYIKRIIIQNSKTCAADRNFGRLFLSFLQTEKAIGGRENMKILEECLEVHTSPFQRPCCILLKEINEN